MCVYGKEQTVLRSILHSCVHSMRTSYGSSNILASKWSECLKPKNVFMRIIGMSTSSFLLIWNFCSLVSSLLNGCSHWALKYTAFTSTRRVISFSTPERHLRKLQYSLKILHTIELPNAGQNFNRSYEDQ
jgi:hypothetical protein